MLIRLFGIVVFVLSFGIHAESMTDDLMSKDVDKVKFDVSKNHFNSHRQLYRQTARSGVDQFVFWCFSGARVKSKSLAFTLSGLEGIFKECFSELKELKCTPSSSHISCKLKISYADRLAQAKLIEKIIDKNPNKEGTKFLGPKELSESCKLDIAKADESSKSLMCTQAIVPLTCPTGEKYNARNGCVGHYLIEAGWKRR